MRLEVKICSAVDGLTVMIFVCETDPNWPSDDIGPLLHNRAIIKGATAL